MVQKKQPPTPEELLSSAERAPLKFKLGPYWNTVETLRQKGYSWREIAQWFTSKGLKVHHSRLQRYEERLAAMAEEGIDESDMDSEDEQ